VVIPAGIIRASRGPRIVAIPGGVLSNTPTTDNVMLRAELNS
jgi:hypothetical protein